MGQIEEEEKLKRILREIVDERCFAEIHELKKKMAMIQNRENALIERITKQEKDSERIKSCHVCREYTKQLKDATTQTTSLPDVDKPTEMGETTSGMAEMNLEEELPPRNASQANVSTPSTPLAQQPTSCKPHQEQPIPSTSLQGKLTPSTPLSEKPTALEPEVIDISDDD